MPVYDDQKTTTRADDDELRRITGIDAKEEKKMESSAVHDGSVAEKNEKKDLEKVSEQDEKSTKTTDKSDLSAENDLYKPGNQGKTTLRGRVLTRRNGLITALVGLLGGGVFGVTSFLSGPAQIVQFGQLLDQFHFFNNEQSTDSRFGRMLEWTRTRSEPSKRNIGYIGEVLSSRYIARLNADGITMSFDNPDGITKNRRVQSLVIDTDTPKGKAAADEFARRGLQTSSVDLGNGRTGLSVDLRGTNAGVRRSSINIAVDSQGKGGISSAISKRLLKARAGVDFHPLKNLVRDKQESFVDWRKRIQEERSERITDGTDTTEGRSLTGNETTDADGNPVTENADIADSSNSQLDELADASTPDLRKGLATKLLGGGAALVGALCVIRDVGDSIPEYQQANVILPMIRMGMEVVTTSSQVMSGQDVTLDELGAVSEFLYDEETQTSWSSARGMQLELGQDPTGPDIPTEAKLQDGKAGWLFSSVDRIPGLGTACGVSNTIKKIPIIGRAVSIVESVQGEIIDGALGIFGTSTQRIMDAIVGFFAGDVINSFSQGADFGNLANLGARLSVNESAIAMGGTVLTGAEVAELKLERDLELDHQFSQKPLYARLFDMQDTRSLVSRALIQNPSVNSRQELLNTVATIPRMFGSVAKSTFSIFTPRALAASNFDESGFYGFEKYGFSVADLESDLTVDPYENADIVEANWSRYERFQACFGTSINQETGALTVGASKHYDDIESNTNCADTSEDMQRYKMYLLDTYTARSMACYESIDELACEELGITGGVIGATTTTTGTTTQEPTAPVEIVAGDTSSIPCAAGKDGGVNDGYDDGQLVRIRTCFIPSLNSNTVVNSQISAQINSLYVAARAANIPLNGGGFRTLAGQEQLFRARCPTTPFTESCTGVARPRYSNHQMGLAIDFTCAGVLIPQRYTNALGNQCYQWLLQNAGRFGLKEWGNGTAAARQKAGYEGWHWSVDGN